MSKDGVESSCTNMQRLVATFLFLACVASGLEIPLSDEGKEYIEKCRVEHHLEKDQIKDAVNNKKVPETLNGKCFLECVMQHSGVLEDGKINLDKAKALNAKKLKDRPEMMEKVNQVFDTCYKEVQNPGGKCEFGVEIAKCLLKTGKELGIPAPVFT